jgi:hypothetical protein
MKRRALIIVAIVIAAVVVVRWYFAKWEYKVLDHRRLEVRGFQEMHTTSGSYQIDSVSKLQAGLNGLSREGWELVMTAPHQEFGSQQLETNYIFRRSTITIPHDKRQPVSQ